MDTDSNNVSIFFVLTIIHILLVENLFIFIGLVEYLFIRYLFIINYNL